MINNITELIEKINKGELPDIESCRELVKYGLYDSLSGLRNRHALEIKIKEIDNSDSQHIGVVFADVNALKNTNDHYGHNSGDTLIRKCAFLLITQFGEEYCYRVSGDEFIILIDNRSEKWFKKEVETFYDIINSKELPPLSLGWYHDKSYGDTWEIIDVAEQRMRQDKTNFYKKFEKFKR